MVTKPIIAFFFGWAARLRSIPSLVRLWRKRTNEGWPKEEWRWAKSTKMIFKRCKKAPKKPPARKKSFLFLHRTAFSVLQWGKRVGRPERPFYFPTFLFPTQFFPHAVSLTAHVRWVWNTASDFFLLPIFVHSCFCVLTASGRAAALNFDSVELNWTFPDWIEFFSEWIELFPSLAYSKRIQSNNQEANKERKVKNKTKERKERVFDKYLKQKGKNSGERDRCGGD